MESDEEERKTMSAKNRMESSDFEERKTFNYNKNKNPPQKKQPTLAEKNKAKKVSRDQDDSDDDDVFIPRNTYKSEKEGPIKKQSRADFGSDEIKH